MKKNLFLWAVFAITMALTGCTQEEKIVYVENETGILQEENVIEISLSSNVATRAARPIGSSEATNNVNRLLFKFYNNDQSYNGASITAVSSENGGTTYENVISEGNIITISDDKLSSNKKLRLTLTGLPSNGSNDFKIVAYGYNATGESPNFPLTSISEANDGVESYGATNLMTEEIFAGHVEVTVNRHGKLNRDDYGLTLTRQVAGLLAYFTDIPVWVDNQKVAKITVETGVKNTGIKFPASLLPQPDFNGITGGYQITPLLTFDMTQADNYEDVTEETDFYTFEEQIGQFLYAKEMTDDTKPANLKCEKNTLFGSCFLCPFNGHQSGFNINNNNSDYYDATLNIVYYNTDDKVIKKIPLKIKEANIPDKDDATTAYYYDIRCNNFYSIGTKTMAEDGGKVPEDDEPLPIDPGTGYTDFFVSMNDSWNVVGFDQITGN